MPVPVHSKTAFSAAVLILLMATAVTAAPPQRMVIQGAPDSGLRLRGSGSGASQVCVDTTSSPAWTLLYSTTDASCAEPSMERDPLAEFPSTKLRRMLRARIIDDAFPDFDVLEQIAAFVRRYPSQPVGLTFDGGMAITATDYRAAEQRYAARKR